MGDTFCAVRDNINHFLYKNVAKPIFFRMDPEDVHGHVLKTGKIIGNYKLLQAWLKFTCGYENKALHQELKGITFKNPIGLAAGFDKNAELTDTLPYMGFGWGEVGSITGERCEGNPRPRLWRLPKSEGLVIYYGLKNDGCEAIAERLKDKTFAMPIGVSVAKTNCADTVDLKAGIADYVKAYRTFLEKDIGVYYTVNISCPNAFGGQPFTDEKKLDALFTELNKIPKKKPVFLKLSPDLTKEQMDGIIKMTKKHDIDGLICCNLTKKKKDNPLIKDPLVSDKGGISGKVVEGLADDMIRYMYKKTKGSVVIVGCGGVFTAEDAYRKIRAGSSLIQMITGMIFRGPQVIGEINRGLVKLLKRDGFNTISEAVGADHK